MGLSKQVSAASSLCINSHDPFFPQLSEFTAIFYQEKKETLSHFQELLLSYLGKEEEIFSEKVYIEPSKPVNWDPNATMERLLYQGVLIFVSRLP